MIHWTRHIRRLAALGGILLWSAGSPAEQYAIPLFASAGTSESPRSVLRIVNGEDESGTVEIWAIDDAGNRTGPAAFTLNAGAAAEFDAMDLASGNSAKGLSGGIGPLTRDVRLEIGADLHIVPLAYARAADGTLSAMHDTAPDAAIGGLVVDQAVGEAGSHRYVVPLFNPASEGAQASRLRLINPGDTPASVTVGARDDSGAAAPGGVLRLTLPAGGARTLTALELEAGGESLQGRLGAGFGKWRLTVASDRPLQAVSVAASVTGWYWNNLSTVPNAETVPDSMPEPVRAQRYTIPLFAAPGSPGRPQGVLRIVNGAGEAGTVAVHAIDDAGVRTGPATFTLGAFAAAEFTAAELASGDPARGLSNGIGPLAGDVRLEIGTDLPIMALAYARAADGALSAMHDTVPAEEVGGADGEVRSYRYEVPLFNSASEAVQASRLRLVNPGDAPATVTIGGRDDSGAAAPGGGVRLTLPPGGARTLTALELEAGGAGLQGRLGAGVGRWRLTVSSDQTLLAVNAVASGAGHLNNLSTVAAETDGAVAVSDFDLDADNGRAEGVTWANGRIYVVDAGADKVFAYGADGRHDATADFNLDGDNSSPTGIAWSGGSFHVVDSDDKVYAYGADGQRQASADFDLHDENGRAEGIVHVDGRYFVVDGGADKVFAYGADGGRDASAEFDLDGANVRPEGIAWSDDSFQVVDGSEDKVYAYGADGQRLASADFDLDGANGRAKGIAWSGASFLVVDATDERVYTYAGPMEPGGGTPPDAQPGFAAGSGPGDQTYTAGMAIDALTLPAADGGDGMLTYTLAPDVPGLSFDATTRRLTGTPTAAGTYAMTYASTDADGDTATLRFAITVQAAVGGTPPDAQPTYTAGDTVPGLPAGSWAPDAMSGVRVANSADGTRIEFDEGGYIEVGGYRYTCRSAGGCEIAGGAVLSGMIVRMPAAATAPDAQPSFATGFVLHEDNDGPSGITYADGRFYILNNSHRRVYAYEGTGERDASAEFDLHPDNNYPTGIAYANGRFHIVDYIDDKVYAYRADGQRDAWADFDLHANNGSPYGIVFADGRFHVVDYQDNKVYAYRVDGQRDEAADIALNWDYGVYPYPTRPYPYGIAYADGRFYVVDLNADKVLAYGTDGELDSSVGFYLSEDNQFPLDIVYADGAFYVLDINSDNVDLEVYAYREGGTTAYGVGRIISGLPSVSWKPDTVSYGRSDQAGNAVSVRLDDRGYFEKDGFRYTCQNAGGCEVAAGAVLLGTMIRTASGVAPPDARPSLPAGSDAGERIYTFGAGMDALKLPAASGGDGTLTYTLTHAVPGLSFNAAARQLVGTPTAAGTYAMTYTVTDSDGDLDAFDFVLVVPRDFALHEDNKNPQGIAHANGRFYVVDQGADGGGKVYAYREDGQRDASAEFDLDETNVTPEGIVYANNRFYVVDITQSKVYAYHHDGERDASADFAVHQDNAYPMGITHADGRFYIVYRSYYGGVGKVYAYRHDGERDASVDFELHGDYVYPQGITHADGRFYVVYQGASGGGKVYAYRHDGERDASADFDLREDNRGREGIVYANGRFYVVDWEDKVYEYQVDPDLNGDGGAGDGGAGRATTYGNGVRISSLPTGLWVPEAINGGEIIADGGQTRIRLDNGGHVEVGAYRYTCESTGGCQVVDREVESGTIIRTHGSLAVMLILHEDNGNPIGITYAHGRFYIVDSWWRAEKVYAYRFDGQRDASVDFDLHDDNSDPQGIAYADGRFYVVDWRDDKVYAYTQTGEHDPTSDFNLHEDNGSATGIAYADGRFYVVDRRDDKVYAYTQTGEHDPSSDFDLHGDNNSATGITYADGRFYVAEADATRVDQVDKVYAYRATGEREESSDFDLHWINTGADGNGITYAGGRFYVVDYFRNTASVYNGATGKLINPVVVDEFPDSRLLRVYHDNVVAMQVEEDLSTARRLPLAAYTANFYQWFEDEFDFLLFVTNLPVGSGSFPYYGLYYRVMNDTEGLDLPMFLNSEYGSAGRLRGVIHLPYLSYLSRGPSLHELQHTWSNYAVPSTDPTHWGFSSANGQLGGFDIANLEDLGGGRWTAGSFATFANGGNGVPYSPIELYFAGLIPPEEVPDLWVAEDGEWLVENGARVTTESGDPVFTAENVRTYTIEDIIAEYGPRKPAEARRDQRAAVIVLTDGNHELTVAALHHVSKDATAFSLQGDDGTSWSYNYYEATGGRATLTLDGLSGLLKGTASTPTTDLRPRFSSGNEPVDRIFALGTAIDALTLPVASGGDGALTYSLSPSVPGLSFDAATRQLTGTPTEAGTHNMIYKAVDADGDRATLEFTIAVVTAEFGFDLDADNRLPFGMAYANGRFYVLDLNQRKVYAYREDGQRDTAADFDLDEDNDAPTGIAYANGRFYVVEMGQLKVYAYRPDGQRDTAADFHLQEGHVVPFRITYANGRFYFVNDGPSKSTVYAYREDGQRDASADFELHEDNAAPQHGIAYANGRFYVVDINQRKVYAYREDGQRDTAADFNLDEDNREPFGIAHVNGRFYVADAARGRVFAYREDGQRDGAGGGAPETFGLDEQNLVPIGIAASDGRLHVVDFESDRVYGYREDGQRDTAADFDLDEDNRGPFGIAHANGRLHVIDVDDKKVYAYSASGQRDAAVDFELHEEFVFPGGIVYANGRFHVVDKAQLRVFAYRADGQRDASADFDLHEDHVDPFRITYANGRFYFVNDGPSKSKVYAYREDGQRDASADFDLHETNAQPHGIAYANNRFYVVDITQSKVYAYRDEGEEGVASGMPIFGADATGFGNGSLAGIDPEMQHPDAGIEALHGHESAGEMAHDFRKGFRLFAPEALSPDFAGSAQCINHGIGDGGLPLNRRACGGLLPEWRPE